MDNLFSSDNFPDQEPDELVLGDHWAWTRSDITEAYPTAAYTLHYYLNKQDSTGSLVQITAGKVSSAHVVELDDETDVAAGTLSAGTWEWVAKVVRDSDGAEKQVDHGYLEILEDFPETPGDTRSHTLKVLQAIRALIEGSATKEQASYSIAGRSLSRRSLEELIAMEVTYQKRWDREKAKLDRKAGRTAKKKSVIVRMSGN